MGSAGIRQEVLISDSLIRIPSIEEIDSNIKQCICKIRYSNTGGTGFFLKFEINEQLFFFLISNEHVITKDIIKKNETIKIDYDNELRQINIKLDENKRYIQTFTDKNLDITVVEIINEDNVDEKYFLFPELNIDENLINRKIYILQYPLLEKLQVSDGSIKLINIYEFTHLASTKLGSSGSPIFLKDSAKVIGIHTKGNEKAKENYGNIIYPIFNKLTNDIDKMKGNYGKYIFENKKYYIGQIKNGLPNGKGKEYYYDGELSFEGEYLNGEKNGKCKEFRYNGKLSFEGEYLNGEKNGKCKEYHYNGELSFEGEYLKGKKNGKCKEYDSFGDLSFEGEYLNGKKWNGKCKEYRYNGKLIFEGEYLKGKKNGKCKEYRYNGKLSFEGEYLNGEKNGKCKEYYDNGKLSFEGEYLNGEKNAKCKEYYDNGKLSFEGEYLKC